jgi:hypothetical protein
MKSNSILPGLVLGFLLIGSPVFAPSGLQPVNIDGISAAMGRQGDRAGGMYKVSFPRSDLNVKVGNLAIKPALSLVAWAAFIKSGDTATTYGDLVLLDEEINPVISKLEERGIEVAALHNHLCTRIPGSCTSISSDAAMRWQWRREFARQPG